MSRKRFYEQPSGDDLVYIEFETDHGRVVAFSVQYAARIDGRWRDVKRTETAHGRLHVHRFWLPHDRQVQDLDVRREDPGSYDVALREAIIDIKDHWHEYRAKLVAALALDPWPVRARRRDDSGEDAV